MKSIPGLLLSAGSSERFGHEKLLAALPTGERLMERSLRAHITSHVFPLIVVASPNLGKTIMSHPQLLSCSQMLIEDKVDQWHTFSCRWGRGRLITNEDHRQGISSSIRAGLSCLMDEEKARGILISLADLPFLTSETINVLVNEYLRTGVGMLAPVFEGVTGHPVIVDVNRFQDDINQITGDTGLRVLLRRYPKEVKKMVAWHDDSVTFDIDTPRDLEKALKRLGNETGGETLETRDGTIGETNNANPQVRGNGL
jgi:CTP:molybdopterin cytidylyltransferase MocA